MGNFPSFGKHWPRDPSPETRVPRTAGRMGPEEVVLASTVHCPRIHTSRKGGGMRGEEEEEKRKAATGAHLEDKQMDRPHSAAPTLRGARITVHKRQETRKKINNGRRHKKEFQTRECRMSWWWGGAGQVTWLLLDSLAVLGR